MTPLASRATAARVLFAACAATSLPGQALDQSGLWVRSPSRNNQRLDAVGRVLDFAGLSIHQPPRRALDGSVWSDGGRSVVQRRSLDGSLASVSLASLNIAGMVHEIVTDRQSRGLVLTDMGELLELTPQLTLARSWSIGFDGTALEVGSDGAVWIGLRNQPGALLARFDRDSGTRQIVAVPSSLGEITDILPDGRPNGGHVFVCGAASGVVAEIGSTLQSPVTYDTGAASGLHALELDVDGSVLVAGEREGFALDPIAGTTRQVIGRGVLGSERLRMLAVDGEGRLWSASDSTLSRWGASRNGVVLSRTFDAVDDAEDAGGVWMLSVLDPQGDQDGDGVSNVREFEVGSSPWDDLSLPELDLDVHADAPRGGVLRADLRGAAGVGVLAISAGASAMPQPVVLPGILGEFRLPQTGPLFVSSLLTIPGRLEVPLPATLGSLDGFTLQALRLPALGAQARFSDAESAQLRSRRDRSVTVDLFDTSQQDALRSGGPWAGGIGMSRVGGHGLLGSFDPTVGVMVGPDTWEFSTDDQSFPAGATLFGNAIRVTDGVFDFTDLVIPAGVTVRFSGSRPAVLKVRGVVQIDGVLDASGQTPVEARFDGRAGGDPVRGWQAATGQAGGSGGPGGGSGGRGGDGCELDGDPAGHAGRSGEAVQPLATSGYAGLGGLLATGGPGSAPFPRSALRADVTYGFFNSISTMVSAGGGGGGWQSTGQRGRALASMVGRASDLSGPSDVSDAFVFLSPLPGVSSLEHFAVGGSGGGGGGSHPLYASRNQLESGMPMHAGAGGGGGGGALALRIGGGLNISPSGRITVAGAAASRDLLSSTQGPPAPGGGGSAGSLLIQVESASSSGFDGVLDLRGGAGGLMDARGVSGVASRAVGGDGGHGLLRVEFAGALPSPAALGSVEPQAARQAESIAALDDLDPLVGQQSVWIPLGDAGRGRMLRHYEITVRTGGVDTVYTDDPTRYRPANLPGLPLRCLFQGAELGPDGEVLRHGPWRDLFGGAGGLALDGTTDAARFMVLFDRRIATDTLVTRVRLVVEE